jgi:hypothetical protein
VQTQRKTWAHQLFIDLASVDVIILGVVILTRNPDSGEKEEK